MKPNTAYLLTLLSNNDVTFFIPPYQRNYEWTDDQCEVFLDDIFKTYEKNKAGEKTEHFIGTVTYFQTESVFGQPSKLVLIDGQQRITTAMLFLVALRDTIADQKLKRFIDSKYLRNENVDGDSEYKIKLKQVESDWASYRNIILGLDLSEKEKNSAVFRNYSYFKNRLSALQDNGHQLQDLIEKGLDRFSLITVQLEPDKNEWENPQEIFESMNSLGKPLSLADLVRNYLLLGLDADLQSEYYNRYWLHIEEKIPGHVSDFIRDYMQAYEHRSFRKATEANFKELYSLFKNIFKDFGSRDLLESLAEYADAYAMILPGGKSGNDGIDKLLDDLNRLSVTTAYSFLMELMQARRKGQFDDYDIIEIIDAFRIYSLRRRLIGATTAENKSFPLLGKKLNQLENAKNKRAVMFKILANQENSLRLPNDIEIKRTILDMNFYNFRYCKLFLSMIEEKLTKSRPDQSDENLQIEHIMPRTLNREWKDALGPDAETIHQQYINSIGNLTLIRHNQELGQKPFNEKKDLYDNNAGLQIARTMITSCDEWNGDTITSRAEWLITYLLETVLPIPDDMRKTNNFIAKENRGLSFNELQLVGLYINFISDPSIKAKVVSNKEVEFEGKKWKLSPLTKEIMTRKGKVNNSGAYQGAKYWEYDDICLADIM